MLADVIDRLMPEGALTAPPSPRVDAFAGGEWDWYYALSPAGKRKVLRHCQRDGLGPDTCAHAAGYDDVEVWARELLAAVEAPRSPKTEPAPFAQMLDASELVGPVEVAAMLDVAANTIHQWVRRGVLPVPWAVVSGTRLWSRWEILEWADETGRGLVVDPGEIF